MTDFPKPPTDKLQSPEILIVDDHEENLLVLEGILEDCEVTPIRALSGQEALSLTLDHDFAVVLLDVMMPEMDGFETARLIRARKETQNLPIIFVTAVGHDLPSVFKGYRSGAVDYLLKPVDPDILRSKVRVFRDLHRQRCTIEMQYAEIEEKNRILEEKVNEIHQLRGLLPICSLCKKIRDESGYWEAVEVYIADRSEADFSHSVCPECMERHYADLDDDESDMEE